MIGYKFLNPEKIAFISAKGAFFYKQFDEIITRNKNVIEHIEGRRIVLNRLDSLSLAILIPVLEDVAKSVLIIPDGFGDLDAVEIINNTNVDFEVRLEEKEINLTKVVSIDLIKEKSGELVDTKWCIPTSGTTGKPKLVVHTLKSLTRTVISNTQNGIDHVWGLTYQISRFAGLQVYFQSLFGNSTLVIPDDKANLRQKILFLSEKNVTAISATPSFWRNLLMTGLAESLSLKRITLGGEISDQNILDSLKVAFPLSKIVHIYASTEAGVGFSVTDGKEGFPLDFCSSGIKGVNLKVNSDNCLLIKSLCNEQFYFDGKSIFDTDGFVNTGDVVKVSNNRILFLGRNSGAINVGGNKVHPEEVESVILTHPNVELCCVKGHKNSIMGSLIVAEIKVDSVNVDFKVLSSLLKTLCKDSLEPFKVPFKFIEVSTIETSSAGKILRS